MKRQSFGLKTLKFLRCLYRSFIHTINHDGIEHSGYMAFLGMLCIFPFLVFLLALAGFLGTFEAGSQFIKIFLSSIPRDVAKALNPRIEELINAPPVSFISIAIIGTIWTASSMVEGLRTTLNRAYRVHTPPAYVWRRLLSIAQFLILTFALIIAMFILLLSPLLIEKYAHFMAFDYSFIKSHWFYVRYIISSLILFIVVALLYYILPNVKQTPTLVLPGAIYVVFLWSLAAIGFSAFITHYKQLSLVYGGLAGIIVTLLFFYVFTFIFIYGAEFNYLFEKSLGKRFKAKIRKKSVSKQTAKKL